MFSLLFEPFYKPTTPERCQEMVSQMTSLGLRPSQVIAWWEFQAWWESLSILQSEFHNSVLVHLSNNNALNLKGAATSWRSRTCRRWRDQVSPTRNLAERFCSTSSGSIAIVKRAEKFRTTRRIGTENESSKWDTVVIFSPKWALNFWVGNIVSAMVFHQNSTEPLSAGFFSQDP